MDHIDWLNEKDVLTLCYLLDTQVLPGGRILLRSASLNPPYLRLLKRSFSMSIVNTHKTHYVCDKINMYASTYVGIKN